MPVCLVCGDEDFQCEDGLFYCTTCSTQTQEFIDQETERFEFTGGITRQIIRQKAEKRKIIKAKEDYRPWVTSEGLTIILREQVKALISLGASPALKVKFGGGISPGPFTDIVLRMWAYYLRETGLGFGGEDSVDAAKTYGSNSRFVNLPTSDDGKPLWVAKKLQLSKKRREKANVAVEDQQVLRAVSSTEEFYDEDNPLIARALEPTELDMFMEMEEAQQQENKSKCLTSMAHNHKMVRKGLRMMLPTTLAFCYIGLQYTNNLIILNDIIKAVKLGKIPYNTGALMFPSNMKLNGPDWRFFSVHRPPGVEHLRYNAARLCRVLDVFPLPKPDFGHLTLRFLFDLNLPANLHTIIRALLQIDEPRYGKAMVNNVPSHELLAMAYVVIATKMVLSLNDDIEGKLSTFSDHVADVLGSDTGIRLFKWTDWLKDQAIRKLNSTTMHEDWRNVRTSTNTDPFCRDFDRSCSLKSTNPQFKRYNEANTIKGLTSVLRQMCSKVNENMIKPNAEQINHPPSQSSETWREPEDTLPVDEPASQETTADDYELNTRNANFSDFTQYSILHFLDLEYFIEQVVTQTGLEYMESNLRELSEQHIKAWENYVFYPCMELKSCHKSYAHFIELAASHIGYGASRLHFFVQHMELIYFNEKKKLVKVLKHLKAKEKSFRKFYFSKNL